MHGFAFARKKYVTLDFPGASNTAALGINDRGEIVGWYVPSGQLYSQAFIYSDGQYNTVFVHGKPSISVNAVNNLGHIYGDILGTFVGKNSH
jgi:probable HAF family extracellular repeat protein